jgi:hypothetical protein
MAKKKRLRDKLIQFWVTESEYNMVKDKADYCGLSISEYMRNVGVDGAIIKRDFKDIFYELNKIGVNINQLAKRANESGIVVERDVDELRNQYEKMFELYYEHVLNG